MQLQPTILYRTSSATLEEVEAHLQHCNENFIPPLSEKTDIAEYAAKILQHAVRFEAWVNDILVGLVAVYFNDPEHKTGFITNVSTMKAYVGRGIASELLKMSIEYGKLERFTQIMLEVEKENTPAVSLYRKFMFEEHKMQGGSILMKRQLVNEINKQNEYEA